MQLILTFLIIIMTLELDISINSKEIEDLSERCKNGRTLQSYLTTGLGNSDISVLMIASYETFKCTLEFSVKPENYVMVVLEFPDWDGNSKICSNENNYVNMVSDNIRTNVCRVLDTTHSSIFNQLHKNLLSVKLYSQGDLNTIKITVTAMRDTLFLKCMHEREVECIYNNKLYCMTGLTFCDGDANCGVRNRYDEDKMVCTDTNITPSVIISSILMGTLTFFLFLSILVTFLPKRKETFVYRFDQTVFLFDSDVNQSNVEINIKVVFPTEKKIEEIHLKENN